MDGHNLSPQDGRIIPRGWKFQVHKRTGIILVHKMDGISQEDENPKSKMDKYNQSPKMDGSSQEDENSKSKNGRI